MTNSKNFGFGGCGTFHVQMNKILTALKERSEADNFYIAGSIAKSAPMPGDIDLVIDLRHEHYSRADILKSYTWVLKLGHRSTTGVDGLLDPFLMFANTLLCRNEYCTGWITAKKATMLRKEFLNSMVPLKQVSLLDEAANNYFDPYKR